MTIQFSIIWLPTFDSDTLFVTTQQSNENSFYESKYFLSTLMVNGFFDWSVSHGNIQSHQNKYYL